MLRSDVKLGGEYRIVFKKKDGSDPPFWDTKIRSRHRTDKFQTNGDIHGQILVAIRSTGINNDYWHYSWEGPGDMHVGSQWLVPVKEEAHIGPPKKCCNPLGGTVCAKCKAECDAKRIARGEKYFPFAGWVKPR